MGTVDKKETYKSSCKRRCAELWGHAAWGACLGLWQAPHALPGFSAAPAQLPALVGMASSCSWSALSGQELFHITKPVVLLGWLPLGFSSKSKKVVKIEWFLLKKMESMRINLQDIALTEVWTGQEEGNYYFKKIKRHSSKGSAVYPPGRNTQVYFCPGKLFLNLWNVTLVTASLRSLLSIRLLSNSLCFIFVSFLLLHKEDIFPSSCPLSKCRSNPPALPENA